MQEVYHYKRLIKLTLVKLVFSHLDYRSMQSQEKNGRIAKSRKVNQHNPSIKKQREGTFTY